MLHHVRLMCSVRYWGLLTALGAEKGRALVKGGSEGHQSRDKMTVACPLGRRRPLMCQARLSPALLLSHTDLYHHPSFTDGETEAHTWPQ